MDSEFDNFTLNSIKKKFEFEKIIFTGKIIEPLPFVINSNKEINQKFESMLNEWFNHFSKGKKVMNFECLEDFLSIMDINNPEEEIENDYEDFFVDNHDFIQFYKKFAINETNIVWNNVEKMKYWKNFEKIKEIDKIEIKEINKLKRYILGNDTNLFNSLIKIFEKSNKKDLIFSFLNSLYTNEDIYNVILNNFINILSDNCSRPFFKNLETIL